MTTGFIGLLFDSTYNISHQLRNVSDISQKDCIFVPQIYYHTTLIYMGSEFKNHINELKKDDEFVNQIIKLKNKKCVFHDIDFIGASLVYIYKFEDEYNNKLLDEIIDKYETYPHSPYFHITIGHFFDKYNKIKFLKSVKNIAIDLLKNTYFNLDTLELISVTENKYYYLEDKLFEN